MLRLDWIASAPPFEEPGIDAVMRGAWAKVYPSVREIFSNTRMSHIAEKCNSPASSLGFSSAMRDQDAPCLAAMTARVMRPRQRRDRMP